MRYVLDTTVASALMRVDDFDLAIAAHAIVDDAAVVTRKTRRFVRIRSLRVEDWT